ncbi:DNA-binding response regulator [Fructobacillus cardui]|uniref:LytTR family DNA-binding domain-containing protein n=1 Tax=Fructobacillus cardui TaxID=2893170 RepID=UPI002D9C96B4|nr:DNA-binding response regulator [Fructobacillus cardui]
MKVSTKIDQNTQTPNIVIFAKQKTAEIVYLEHEIQSVINHSSLFVKDQEDYQQIELPSIDRFYTEEHEVYCQVNGQRYKTQKRIYELADFLPENLFIQISQSEIINRHFIQRFQLSKTGAYEVILRDGQTTFASRRYMRRIKKENLSWKSSKEFY